MDDTTAARMVADHYAFEASDDVDGVLATLAPDATHHLVGSPWGERRGHDEIRAFYEVLFDTCRGESVTPLARWHGDGFVVDDARWAGTITDALAFGLPGRHGRAEFRLLHVFELREGLITREVVWPDAVTLGEQLE